MLKLKEERIKNGYTQKEIASEIGICERQYIRIEKGYLPPTYHVILKLEDLFGMSHRELFKTADVPKLFGDREGTSELSEADEKTT